MGQQLTMTPQLQQAIRLLQLSTLDLQQEIQEALESNPMLEREEDGDDFDNSNPLADGAENPTPAAQQEEPYAEPSHQETPQTVDNLEEGEWNERIPNELPVDTAWEDVYQTSASSLPSNNDDDEWDFTTRTSSGESLQSHLLWQLNLVPMSDKDRLIGITLIDCINYQGYLEESLEEVLAASTRSWTSNSTRWKPYCTASSSSSRSALPPATCANACSCNCASCRPGPPG
jgi:RNA polymerase sigma-54 factor